MFIIVLMYRTLEWAIALGPILSFWAIGDPNAGGGTVVEDYGIVVQLHVKQLCTSAETARKTQTPTEPMKKINIVYDGPDL